MGAADEGVEQDADGEGEDALADADGESGWCLREEDAGSGLAAYATIFGLVFADAIGPIFPGETTLNAASVRASQDKLELVIFAGALGALLGDSCLLDRPPPARRRRGTAHHARGADAVSTCARPAPRHTDQALPASTPMSRLCGT